MEPPSNKTSIGLQYIIKGLFAKALFLVPWLWASGDWMWFWAWLYIGIFILFDIITVVVVDPGLLVERGSKHDNTKRWDIVYVSFAAFLLPLLSGVVAGLSLRLGWETGLPVFARWIATIVCSIGFGIVAWSMHANAYFSAVVRIQNDRGHQVATGGPYQYIRHPGYIGAMLFTLALPVMLGSLLGLILGVLASALYISRTKREDETLQAELPGYKEFTQHTKYRLIPGIW
jgi:protein-S-isoprenylcysteine O-methyltransferase Ste14